MLIGTTAYILHVDNLDHIHCHLQAKAQGTLLECGCCFDSEVMLEDMAACNEGHLFCKDCVRK
jgi:hypothetical protein